MEFLKTLNGPNDLKKIKIQDLPKLAEEIRSTLINKIRATGGHMGSNLGIVEATIAMHYVFSSPIDKFIYDVSHQSYTHKILTGRKQGFLDPDHFYDLSGYTTPKESIHDTFKVGHTSTSISLACGMADARNSLNDNYKVIALIGDGALSGGISFEGLNNASRILGQLLIIINDNEMSIADNQGGIYKNLEELRNTEGKSALNYFKAFGFDYYYLEEGNDVIKLVEVLEKLKDINHPVILHIHTTKGKGFEYAETNKEEGHWMFPNNFEELTHYSTVPTYDKNLCKYFLEKIKEDKSVKIIAAATPGSLGLTKEFRKAAGANYIDCGIAEEHAVAYAASYAKAGGRSILCIGASFLQRSYDQLSQELALNDAPAVILVYASGISGGDATHIGMYDITLIRSIPNIIGLSPTSNQELLSMLDWALSQRAHPVVIRVPDLYSYKEDGETFSYPVKYNKINLCDICIVGLGSKYSLAESVAEELSKKGLKVELINPKIYTEFAKDFYKNLPTKLLVVLDDGALAGGFAEGVANVVKNSSFKLLTYGAKRDFLDMASTKEVLEINHLTKELIINDVLKEVN